MLVHEGDNAAEAAEHRAGSSDVRVANAHWDVAEHADLGIPHETRRPRREVLLGREWTPPGVRTKLELAGPPDVRGADWRLSRRERESEVACDRPRQPIEPRLRGDILGGWCVGCRVGGFSFVCQLRDRSGGGAAPRDPTTHERERSSRGDAARGRRSHFHPPFHARLPPPTQPVRYRWLESRAS